MEKRSKLTNEQLAAAARLKRVWDAQKKQMGLTQEGVAARFGWDSQSTVSQYLNGRIPLNVQAVIRFCRLLNVDEQEIYPELFDFEINSAKYIKRAPENQMKISEALAAYRAIDNDSVPPGTLLIEETKSAILAGYLSADQINLIRELLRVFKAPN